MAKPRTKKLLKIDRYFTGQLPTMMGAFDEVDWELRESKIVSADGKVVFSQSDVEVPVSWSQTATNIVASKYFYGKQGTPEREHSVKQLVHRITRTIADWGLKGGYFYSAIDAENFYRELTHLMVNQKMAFNSPVEFNIGTNRDRTYGFYWDPKEKKVKSVVGGEQRPQCSACFIQSVDDSMESIMELAKSEAMLFKYGSGSGSNLSSIREENAGLTGGGRASGPLSFMKGLDAFAGVIKSGGTTRRAAKLICLDVDHPDVEAFINCKSKEEGKAQVLIAAGYDPAIDGEAYTTVAYQNANNSVRLTDNFMKAVEDDADWDLLSRVNGKVVKTVKARKLLTLMAEAAHASGDPGCQYDTTINNWHTVKNSGRINASNPCSEYMHLDDSACNLASLNLMKFARGKFDFDVEAYKKAIELTIIAQEIIVENASYPTEKIAKNSYDFRPLGLGYANLGALLMSYGLPYDSDEGRNLAAALTSILTGHAYYTSAQIAGAVGSFPGYEKNKESFNEVMRMHHSAAEEIKFSTMGLLSEAYAVWRRAIELGSKNGFRNAQASVCAPTGTIGFMMDCDTTGIEPELALVKYKKLVGGGNLKIVNQTVGKGLAVLGYEPHEIALIIAHIDQHGTIEGAPFIKEEHLAVFDCSFKPENGKRSIQWMGHLKMMSAAQPFFSGAISKTINMPESSTVQDVFDAYVEGWKLGLKAVAIYRDNSKKSQPLNVSKDKAAVANVLDSKPFRRRLPDERLAITHKFSIAGHEGYLTVGLFEDGTPGELFVKMAKEGSTISGLMDSFAIVVSYALQHGVPMKFFVDKFSHVRFEPSGFTPNPDVPYAKSIVDYIFRWLDSRFKSGGMVLATAPALTPESNPKTENSSIRSTVTSSDAPSCSNCGAIMVRNASCYKCENCGGTSGCS